MIRRIVVYLLITAPLVAVSLTEAQQPAPFRIGWLSNDRGRATSWAFSAFRDGMHDLGYVEGRNLTIDARWGEGSNERLAQLAVELVSRTLN